MGKGAVKIKFRVKARIGKVKSEVKLIAKDKVPVS
jgi:hypothetical protein